MPHVEVPSAEFKVVLLGDTNTGKTCLVLRLVEGSFKPVGRSSTIGAFFLTKRLTVNNITCKMLLWDTAGQEQFQKLAKTYYQNAAAAIVCYDISNPRSLARMKRSLDELNRHRQSNPMVLAIAACKSDLTPVPGLEDEARRIAKSHDAIYVKTSAKNNTGVDVIFQKTAARVLEWHEMAFSGQARPLNVTVGALSQKEKVSPVNRRQRQMTSSGVGNGGFQDGGGGVGTATGIDMKTPLENNGTRSPLHSGGDGGDHDSATEVESDDVLDSSKTNVDGEGGNVTCEGSMLVCGVNEESRGCVIL